MLEQESNAVTENITDNNKREKGANYHADRHKQSSLTSLVGCDQGLCSVVR